jgi:acyl-CoA thioester hydrolase
MTHIDTCGKRPPGAEARPWVRYNEAPLPPSAFRLPPTPCPAVSRDYKFTLEVRYYETDAQGVVHHANYFKYFELARVHHLRSIGYEYVDLERDGIILVVNKIACTYRLPARFGDMLDITIHTSRARGARIDHEYMVERNGMLLAEGTSTLACIDRNGQVQRLPDYLMIDE